MPRLAVQGVGRVVVSERAPGMAAAVRPAARTVVPRAPGSRWRTAAPAEVVVATSVGGCRGAVAVGASAKAASAVCSRVSRVRAGAVVIMTDVADRIGNVTRQRYEQLVSQAKELIAQVARA